MAEELGEKTEEPTERRKRESREQGKTPKSQDLAAATGLITVTAVLVLMGGSMFNEMLDEVRRVLAFRDDGPRPFHEIDLRAQAHRTLTRAARLAWPPMLVVFLSAYLVQLAQVGPLFTLKAVEPKASKLSVIKGVKRLFSRRNLVKTGVNTLKLVVMSGGIVFALSTRLATLAATPSLDAHGGFLVIGRVILELAAVLLVLLLILGLIDLVYQRWQHRKDLKMTKQEVKDERKSMDGDPEMKRRRMGRYQEIVMQQTRSGTESADVVITNPTHYAVAIRYDHERMRAPEVCAKGADWLALQMRRLAGTAGVPIVERPPLARALYNGIEVGEAIAPEHYEAVAEVLAYVYRLDEAASAAGSSADPEDAGGAVRSAA